MNTTQNNKEMVMEGPRYDRVYPSLPLFKCIRNKPLLPLVAVVVAAADGEGDGAEEGDVVPEV